MPRDRRKIACQINCALDLVGLESQALDELQRRHRRRVDDQTVIEKSREAKLGRRLRTACKGILGKPTYIRRNVHCETVATLAELVRVREVGRAVSARRRFPAR